MSKFNSKLLPEVIKQIRHNKELKNDLCKIMNISAPTLQRWLDRNNPSLTRADAITCIANHLGIQISEVCNVPDYQLQP